MDKENYSDNSKNSDDFEEPILRPVGHWMAGAFICFTLILIYEVVESLLTNPEARIDAAIALGAIVIPMFVGWLADKLYVKFKG